MAGWIPQWFGHDKEEKDLLSLLGIGIWNPQSPSQYSSCYAGWAPSNNVTKLKLKLFVTGAVKQQLSIRSIFEAGVQTHVILPFLLQRSRFDSYRNSVNIRP